MNFQNSLLSEIENIVNISAREIQHEANNYDYVCIPLVKLFKITPEEFRQTFVSHKKESSASSGVWILIYEITLKNRVKYIIIYNCEELIEPIINGLIKKTRN